MNWLGELAHPRIASELPATWQLIPNVIGDGGRCARYSITRERHLMNETAPNQTPQPDDSPATVAAPPPEVTDPAGHPSRGATLRRRAVPLLGGAMALLLVGGLGGYLLASQGDSGVSIGAVDPAASAVFDPGDPGPGDPGPSGPGGFGPGHHQRGFDRGGRGAAGTIDAVDGTTITLTTRDGRKVTVTAAGAVPVILRSEGSVADLKPGQLILVSGPRGADGSVTANRIAVGAKLPR